MLLFMIFFQIKEFQVAFWIIVLNILEKLSITNSASKEEFNQEERIVILV